MSTVMNSKLSKAEKTRAQIIAAAIDEFSENGYIMASTNHIAKRGGFSKSIIFHYFENKQTLFIACLDNAYTVFESFIEQQDTLARQTDVFEIIYTMGKVKYAFYQSYHRFTALFSDAYFLPQLPEHAAIIAHIQSYTSRLIPKIFGDVDLSRFREDIDPQKALSFVIHAMTSVSALIAAKYQNDFTKLYDNLDTVIDELREYADFLKRGVYRILD